MASWNGSQILSLNSRTNFINGVEVDLIPSYDLNNYGISSITANTKTLVHQLPGTYPAGVYSINGEVQIQNNTSGGQTAYAAGHSVDWTVQGVGDPSADYAQATCRPFYCCITTGADSPQTSGTVRLPMVGITALTSPRPIAFYVQYNRTGAGTVTLLLTVTGFSIQKIG